MIGYIVWKTESRTYARQAKGIFYREKKFLSQNKCCKNEAIAKTLREWRA